MRTDTAHTYELVHNLGNREQRTSRSASHADQGFRSDNCPSGAESAAPRDTREDPPLPARTLDWQAEAKWRIMLIAILHCQKVNPLVVPA